MSLFPKFSDFCTELQGLVFRDTPIPARLGLSQHQKRKTVIHHL